MLVSIPVYKKFVGITDTIPNFMFKKLYIRLKDPNDKQTIATLKSQFNNVFNVWYDQ